MLKWFALCSVAVLGMAALTSGCGAVAGDAALPADLVAGVTDLTSLKIAPTAGEQDGTAGLDESAQAAELTDLTAGHPGPGPWPHPPCPPWISAEECDALLALREALEAGEITPEEFCAQAREIIGEPPCGLPPPPIDLTPEQLEQFHLIFDTARDEIIALHEAARDNVLALLTEDQRALLLELLAIHTPPPPPPHPILGVFCPPPEEPGEPACPRPPRVPLPPCPEPPPGGEAGEFGGPGCFGGMGGPGGPGGPPGGPPMPPPGPHPPHPVLCLSPVMIEVLDLTEEQVVAITGIHETLRAMVETVRDEAMEAFLAILTPEQLEALEDLPWPPPPPGHGPPPPPPGE